MRLYICSLIIGLKTLPQIKNFFHRLERAASVHAPLPWPLCWHFLSQDSRIWLWAGLSDASSNIRILSCFPQRDARSSTLPALLLCLLPGDLKYYRAGGLVLVGVLVQLIMSSKYSFLCFLIDHYYSRSGTFSFILKSVFLSLIHLVSFQVGDHGWSVYYVRSPIYLQKDNCIAARRLGQGPY